MKFVWNFAHSGIACHDVKLKNSAWKTTNLFAACENFFLRQKIRNWFSSILYKKNQHFAKNRVKSAWNFMKVSVILSVKFDNTYCDFIKFHAKIHAHFTDFSKRWNFFRKIDEIQLPILCHRKLFFRLAKDRNVNSQIFQTWHFW